MYIPLAYKYLSLYLVTYLLFVQINKKISSIIVIIVVLIYSNRIKVEGYKVGTIVCLKYYQILVIDLFHLFYILYIMYLHILNVLFTQTNYSNV